MDRMEIEVLRRFNVACGFFVSSRRGMKADSSRRGMKADELWERVKW